MINHNRGHVFLAIGCRRYKFIAASPMLLAMASLAVFPLQWVFTILFHMLDSALAFLFDVFPLLFSSNSASCNLPVVSNQFYFTEF